MALFILGVYRDMVIEWTARYTKRMLRVYNALWWLMFACWLFGILWRFKPSGRYACADTPPANLAFNSNPDWKSQVLGDKRYLIQEKSCRFIKLFIDFSGLYIGFLIAWFFMGLTGAARTPSWSPNREGIDGGPNPRKLW